MNFCWPLISFFVYFFAFGDNRKTVKENKISAHHFSRFSGTKRRMTMNFSKLVSLFEFLETFLISQAVNRKIAFCFRLFFSLFSVINCS